MLFGVDDNGFLTVILTKKQQKHSRCFADLAVFVSVFVYIYGG